MLLGRPAVECVHQWPATQETYLFQTRMGRPCHSSRNRAPADSLPFCAAKLPHAPSSLGPSGGSGRVTEFSFRYGRAYTRERAALEIQTAEKSECEAAPRVDRQGTGFAVHRERLKRSSARERR